MNKKNGFKRTFYSTVAILIAPLSVKLIACPNTTHIIEIDLTPLSTLRLEFACLLSIFRDYCIENIEIPRNLLLNIDARMTNADTKMVIVTVI